MVLSRLASVVRLGPHKLQTFVIVKFCRLRVRSDMGDVDEDEKKRSYNGEKRERRERGKDKRKEGDNAQK